MGWRAIGDWGTSRLRLYRVENGMVAGETEGLGIGVSQVPPADVLRTAPASLGDDRPEAIRLCGMAGARGGLAEAAYADCPAEAASWRAAALRSSFDGVPLCIAADVASDRDVMRGEETQIFGVKVLYPALGDVLLPGTHSKWARMDGGVIVGFDTFIAGELHAVALLCALDLRARYVDRGHADEAPCQKEGVAGSLPMPQPGDRQPHFCPDRSF